MKAWQQDEQKVTDCQTIVYRASRYFQNVAALHADCAIGTHEWAMEIDIVCIYKVFYRTEAVQ